MIENNSQEENLTAQREHEEANPTFYAKSLMEKPSLTQNFTLGALKKPFSFPKLSTRRFLIKKHEEAKVTIL